jgi:hypothetical protein
MLRGKLAQLFLKARECVGIVVQRSGEVNQGMESNAGKTRGEG